MSNKYNGNNPPYDDNEYYRNSQPETEAYSLENDEYATTEFPPVNNNDDETRVYYNYDYGYENEEPDYISYHWDNLPIETKSGEFVIRESYEDLYSRLVDSEDLNGRLSREYDKAYTQNNALRAEKDELRKEADEKEESLRKAEAKQNAEFNELERDKEDFEREKSRKKALFIGALVTAGISLLAFFIVLGMFFNQKSRFNDADSANQNSTQQVTSLSDSLEKSRQENESLSQKNKELQDKITKVNDDLAKANRENNKMSTDLKEKDDQLKDLSDRVDELDNREQETVVETRTETVNNDVPSDPIIRTETEVRTVTETATPES